MPIELCGLLEDIESFEGKNGYGANITISAKVGRKTKRITFMTRDKEMVNKLEPLLDCDVIVKVELNQNNFGLRFGDILSIGS